MLQGVSQGCPMSPALFNIYIDAAMEVWKSQLRTNFKLGKWALNTVMVADDQAIFAHIENQLRHAVIT
jgi:hypothetical protein